MKNFKEYQKWCRKVAKKFDDPTHEIMTWGLGIAGEAGDVAGCVKKTYAHGNDQKAGIRENIGDTVWYVAMIANFFGWDLEEILVENMKKINKRYPKGFTEKRAKRKNTRVDWNEK